MENTTKPSMSQTTLTWGVITGFAGVVYSLILYFAGLILNKPAGYVGIIISIAGIYLGIKAYRDQSLDGYISYGRALGTGVLISLYASIITIVYSILLYTVIDPELINKSLEMSREQMAGRSMSEEQIEKGLEFSKKFFVPFIVVGVFFVGNFIGFIISLIVSAFLKKDGDSYNRSMSSI